MPPTDNANVFDDIFFEPSTVMTGTVDETTASSASTSDIPRTAREILDREFIESQRVRQFYDMPPFPPRPSPTNEPMQAPRRNKKVHLDRYQRERMHRQYFVKGVKEEDLKLNKDYLN